MPIRTRTLTHIYIGMQVHTYKLRSKFTRDMNNELIIDFYEIVLLAYCRLIPSSFPLLEATLNLFFLYGVKLWFHIFLNILHVLKS